MMSLGRPAAWLLAAAYISLSMAPQAKAADTEVRANRMQVEYYPPSDPAHQMLYDMLKERRALEKLQAIFGPFRLPIDLTLRTVPCNGISNAWWQRPYVSVCYEYLAEILRSMPKETTAEGVTPSDVIGQFFYVFAHEMGHAMFEMLDVPVFGNAEDAADHFAVFLMLKFEKNEARGLIAGSAYSYRKYVQGSEVSAPLVAFSDAHSAPAQRYFNLLCLAYGSDTDMYGDFVANGHLPQGRANSCKREYNQVAFAFLKSIRPHVDQDLAKQASEREWFPDIDSEIAKK
jgi:hypothetical protein